MVLRRSASSLRRLPEDPDFFLEPLTVQDSGFYCRRDGGGIGEHLEKAPLLSRWHAQDRGRSLHIRVHGSSAESIEKLSGFQGRNQGNNRQLKGLMGPFHAMA